MNSVFSADKDHGIVIRVVADSMPSLMDLKVYAHSIQSGTNACAKSNNCSHICVGAPNKSFTCLCPDEMQMSPNGDCLCPGSTQAFANKTCPQKENTCSTGFYTCANKLCVPLLFRCDGQDDCGDNSDESGCPTSKQPCPRTFKSNFLIVQRIVGFISLYKKLQHFSFHNPSSSYVLVCIGR